MRKYSLAKDGGKTQMKKRKNNRLAAFWYANPRWAIALTLVVVNIAIIFIFTTILAIITHNNFFSELAYIFTFTMSSDGVYDFVQSNDDLICFILKVILAIIQMVIFSGALIGFTTDLLQSTIDKSLNNIGKLHLSNHYVFLNWSSIGPRIVYDLSFLDGKKNVVILCDKDREEVLTSIQNVFVDNKRPMKDLRVFVKEGSPMSSKHLSDISLDTAKHIGILLEGIEDSNEYLMTSNDLNALKTLLTMMNMGITANIVVEAECDETIENIEKLLDSIDPELNKRIIAFSHNSVLGHIMGRSLVDPTYNEVYHELLSYDGVEFYGIPTKDIDEALYLYNDCIPIINYDDDCEVDENGNMAADQLYILSDNEQTLGERAEKKVFTRRLNYREALEREEFTVFILSKDNNVGYVIEELNKYAAVSNLAIKYQTFTYKEDMKKIKEIIKETQGRKKVLMLSSTNNQENVSDADVFLAALEFKLEGGLGENTELYAEILKPGNIQALQNLGVLSVILSNRIISLFMLQLLTHPHSKRFYRDLISINDADGNDEFDLEVSKARELLVFDEECLNFSCQSELVQSFYFSSGKKKMCIGYKHNGKMRFLCDKMDEEETLSLYPDDDLILITY